MARYGKAKRAASLGLAFLLAAGTPGAALAGTGGSWQEEMAPSGTDYSQRPYGPLDSGAFEQAAGELEAAAWVEGQAETVGALYDRMMEELEALAALETMAYVRYSQDLGDEEQAAEYDRAAELLSDAVIRAQDTLAAVYGTSYRPVLEERMGAASLGLEGYEKLPEKLEELYDKERALELEYGQASTAEYTIWNQGKEWSLDTVNELLNEDYDRYIQVYGSLERMRNEALGDIYVRLVKVRAEIAAFCGYESYSDYAYEQLYGRDYTPEDTARLYGPVKDSVLVLISDCWYSQYDSLNGLAPYDTEELLDQVEPYIGQMDGRLGEMFSYMREHGLCDMDRETGESRAGSYTVGMPSYGDSFLFVTRMDDYTDYTSLFHEFGHFAAFCEDDTPWLFQNSSVDACEIQSQALELLMMHYQEELFGERGAAVELQAVSDVLDALVTGAMIDEFETRVYADPDMSLEEMNRLFGEINSSYDQWYFYNDGDACYSWVDIPHVFSQPLYYVSYAVSAYPALELWLQSKEDWEGAAGRYMELSALGVCAPYPEALEACGADSIFEEGGLEAFCGRAYEALELYEDSGEWDGSLDEGAYGERNSGEGMVLLGIGAVVVLQAAVLGTGLVILWAVLRRKGEK